MYIYIYTYIGFRYSDFGVYIICGGPGLSPCMCEEKWFHGASKARLLQGGLGPRVLITISTMITISTIVTIFL